MRNEFEKMVHTLPDIRGKRIYIWGTGNTTQLYQEGFAPYITDHCFTKADIESYEYQMLLGAAEAISARKPKLAICIYHNAVDFVQIPLLIKKTVPGLSSCSQAA